MGSSVKRNIFLTYLFMFFSWSVFFFPVTQIFIVDHGLSLTKIAYIGIVLNVFRVLAEVPSGALSDRWGRVKTIRFIPLLLITSLLIFIIFPQFWGFLVASAFFGIAFAFFSGSIHSFFYDSLLSIQQEKDFKKHLGKMYLYTSIGGAITAGFAGYLYQINPSLPFQASIVSIFLALIVTLFFKEPPKHKMVHQKNYFLHIREAFHDIKKSRELTFIVFYASFITFIFIYLFDFGQVYMQRSNIAITLIGIIYGGRLFVEGIGSVLATKFVKTSKKSFLLLALVTTLGLGIWTFNPQWWVFFIFLFFILGIIRVLNMDYLHQYVNNSRRATIESVISFIIGVIIIILIVPLNHIADLYGLFWSLLILVGINVGVVIHTLRA